MDRAQGVRTTRSRTSAFRTAHAGLHHPARRPGHSISLRTDRAGRLLMRPMVVLASLLTAGCATAPLDQAGSLRSYVNLRQSDGLLTHSLLSVSKDDVLAARTVRIIPTVFSAPAAHTPFTDAQRDVMTNAVDRMLCVGLSERFEVVGQSVPADLTVHAVVTHIAPTDPVAVAVSKGAALAKDVFLPHVPVPVPRIPIGLGSLSLEAEARDPQGRQKAAMIWGRGANALIDSGRIAEDGDAYNLAAAFGDDFSKLLVKGTTPFGTLPSLPSVETVGFLLGGAAKYSACEKFGRSPGVAGLLGGAIGLPPEWIDKGAAARQDERPWFLAKMAGFGVPDFIPNWLARGDAN